jgi:hypothetical protein
LKEEFELNFNLFYAQKIDVKMFDHMVPWERDVYLDMLIQRIEEENEKHKLLAAERKAKKRTQ